MENPVCFPKSPFGMGYEIVGYVETRYGRLVAKKYYIKGHHPELRRFGEVRLITGKTGHPETELVTEGVMPSVAVAVVAAEAEIAA